MAGAQGDATLEFRLLGSVEATRRGEPLDLGARQRALLALLLVHPNEPVGSERIIEALWGDHTPRDRQQALWVVVSRLRSVLDPDRAPRTDGSVVITRPPGYLLAVSSGATDVDRFEALATEGSSLLDGDPAAASLVLSEALALWRGHCLEEFRYHSFAAPTIARLEELRIKALEDRADAGIRMGLSRELVGELEGLVQEHPDRHRLAGHLMIALYRSGRHSDALAAYQSHREYMLEHFGLDPAPEIAALEHSILVADPALAHVPVGDDVDRQAASGLSVRGYELRDVIGRGAMGDVYRAYQPSVGREVVIKATPADLANDPDFIRRFEANARVAAQLEHPFVAPIFDYWREPDGAFLVMRLYERGSLLDVIQGEPLGADEVAQVLHRVASVLAEAHRRGIVHGDLRASNVLIDAEGQAYVTDLGLSFALTAVAGGEVATTTELRGHVGMQRDIGAFGSLVELLLSTLPPEARDELGDVAALVERVRTDEGERFATMDECLDALNLCLRSAPSDTEMPEQVTNPYRGLNAFDEASAAQFFGRDDVVERLVERLGSQERFGALVGPSGSGKSSVVRAGLIPALRRDASPGSASWFIADTIPGSSPFDALAASLRAVATQPVGAVAKRLRSEGLTHTLDALLPDRTTPVLIVIDQLEELFSLAEPAMSAAYLDCVAGALADPNARVRVVATLRADFYDHPLRHRAFGSLLGRGTEVITPLSAEQLEQAIVAPAALMGVKFETGVVSAIIQSMAGQPAALPLLQYLLTELFEARDGSMITADSYEASGGVSQALARRADVLLAALDPIEQQRVRDVFMRLVTLNPGASETRRRAVVDELSSAVGDDVAGLLETFSHHRLLVSDRDPATRRPTVEIAHEALLSEWTQLQVWVATARTSIDGQQRLAAAAAQWSGSDKNSDFALTGARLSAYDGWLDDEPVRLTGEEREFLVVSHALDAESKQTEARRVRRLRRLVTLVAAVSVIALIAGGVAYRQRESARESEAEAVAQAEVARAAAAEAELEAILSRSAALADDQPDVSVLLALQAFRRDPGRRTEQGVLRALSQSAISSRLIARERLATECLPESFFGLGPDGVNEIVSVDGMVRARDAVSGEVTEFGQAPGPCAVGVRTNVDGFAVSIDLSRAWSGPDWEVELLFAEPTFPVFPSTNRFLALTGLFDPNAPNSVTLRDTRTGEVLGEAMSGQFQLAASINADESLFAVSFARPLAPEGDGRLFIGDARTGHVLHRFDTADAAEAIRFDDEGGQLLAGHLGGRLIVYDAVSGDAISTIDTDMGSGFADVAIRSDGTLLAVSRRGIVSVDPVTGEPTTVLDLFGFDEAYFTPDASFLVTVHQAEVVVYDLVASALVQRSWPVDPTGHVAAVAGRAAVLDLPGQQATIVDLDTGAAQTLDLTRADGPTSGALLAYPEPDGLWVLSADYSLARIEEGRWVDDLSLGSAENVVAGLAGRTTAGTRLGDFYAALGRRPDGSQEATLVRLERGAPTVMLTVEVDDALSVHPSVDDGLHVVDREGVVRTYDSGGAIVAEVATGIETAYALSLDPSGRLLALASDEGGGGIVHLVGGQVDPIDGIGRPVSLGFSGDGDILVLVMFDGSVRLWDVERAELAGLVWQGGGAVDAEPGWYDDATGSMWVPSSGRLLEVPLDGTTWIERACEVVGRELTEAERAALLPGDTEPTPSCP